MSGLLDDLEPASVAAANPPTLPPAPKPPKSLLDDLEPVSLAPRAATGALESIQAGFQGSAPGLAWRGKLPDLVINPQHASWWERALSSATQVGSELGLMIPGAIAGGAAGSAVGSAVPVVGTGVGALLGAGAGMGAVPAAIRQTLIEAYKSGDVMTMADFWNSLREVAKVTAMEAGVNAAAMGAGAAAKLGFATAMGAGPVASKAIGLGTASMTTKGAQTAAVGIDLAAQIAVMPTIPAVLMGHDLDAQSFIDAAILIGGLKAAHVTASNITSVFLKTGKTPAEQVADAQANPEVAKQMAEGKPERPAEPEYVAPSRMEMLKVQENLFTETARLDEMAAKAEASPLSDPERLEMNALKARVLDLENQLRAGAPELSRTPTYTADQFVEARKQADTRLAELTTKAETEALTDTERAERVFLSNSLDRPTALAKHFGFEPILTERPTPQAIDASAQRIHDDVLRQLKDADEARKAAGLDPLGDDHAEAVAALVRARVRTRAERLGVLPESLYAERPVKIEDVNKLQGEPGKFELSDEWQVVPDGTVLPSGTETRSSFVTGVTEARRMPGADSPIPQPSGSTGPELDLFGEPIQPPPMESQNQVATIEPAMVPVAGLTLSKDVPQFKAAANAKGVVEPLGGDWNPTGVGPIQIWNRLNGAMEVISGRHRLDLAQRKGIENIWAQVHKESEGFTRDMAATLDAMLNIRDGQGSVADYAQFFKAAGITKDAADRAGLLARGKGKSGFAIARDASPDLLASHRAGNLSDEAALVISSTAPGSERLQALGIAAVQEGKTLLYASNLMRSVDMMAAERMMAGEQGDIFGFDDSALKEASAMAKKASSKQRAISEQIAAVSGASKRPELARKMGVNVEDPAAVQAKIVELKNEQYLWDNWPLYPELVKQLRGEVMKQDATLEIATPDFNRWFAESKATNPDGTPMRVYRGVNGQGTEFAPDINWFSEDPAYASNWATGMTSSIGNEAPFPHGARVLPAYLSVKKPFDADANYEQLPGGMPDTAFYDEAFVAKLKNEGYDGAFWTEYRGRNDTTGYKNWVTFGPDKVKSAIDDRATLFQEPSGIVDKPETPAEAAARDQVAEQAAQRKENGETPNTLFQDRRDSWYRSALGEAIQNANMKSAPAKGWQDFLKGQVAKGGVKADEIKWSGVEDWLKLQDGETEKSAAEKGFTIKAYRGISKSKPFNDSGTVWASTNRDVADAYAKEVFGYDDAAVIEVMVKPTGIPRHDIRRLTEEQRANLALDEFGNPQKVGIYDNSDDSNLGSNYPHTAIHVPMENIVEIGKAPKITKEQVADYLASNGVKVEETMLGSGTPQLSDAKIRPQVAALDKEGWTVEIDPTDDSRVAFVDPNTGDYVTASEIHAFANSADTPAEHDALRAVANAAEQIEKYWWSTSGGNAQSKFHTYQLPGGENYRELALTLPKGSIGPTDYRVPPAHEMGGTADDNRLAHIRFNERTDAEGKKVLFIEEIQSDWAQKGKKEGFSKPPDPEAQKQLEAAEQRESLAREKSQQTWPAARNVVKKYLGGEDQYRSNAGDLALSKMSEMQDISGNTREWQLEYGITDPADVEIIRKAIDDANEQDQAIQVARQLRIRAEGEKGIPAAPFVGKTDAWVSLALKRVIRYAAENGFDKVAWTRGEQQVERYSSALRKAVDVIEWKKTPEGVQLVGYKNQKGQAIASPELRGPALDAVERNDNLGFDSRSMGLHALWEARSNWRQIYDIPDAADQQVIQKYLDDAEAAMHRQRRDKVVDTTEKEDALSDSIGKAMADQIRNDPNQTGTIEGNQITVSDTGMAGFYDKIVPKVAKEVLKKLGGGKVEEVNIGDAQKHDLYVVKTNPTTWQIKDEMTGQWLGHSSEQWVDSPVEAKEFRSESEATQASSKIQDMPANRPQPGFQITPAMREGAMAGQPLFQKQTDQLHRGSYDIAENLITTLQGADKSTVVHELTHSWLEEMKADAARPDAPASIKADWEIIRRELAIPENGEISRASHEQFARTGERYLAEGEAPSRELQSVFARFREWLLDIYKSVMNLNVEINPELRQVLDRMLATDEEIAAARDLGVPRAYVPEAAAATKDAIVPPPEARPARRKINPGFEAEQASMQPYADELPPGPGDAPDNIHVNYAYINTPTDVKLAMQRMAEIDQANIQRQRGGTEGVKSWAEANAEQAKYLNDILGGGPDTLHLFEPRDPDAPHVDVRLGILKKLAVGAAKDSARLRDVVLQAGHDATVRQQLEYMGSIERARMIQAEFLGERASVARALNALKDVTEGTGEIGRMLEAIGLGDEGKLFQAGRTPAEEQAYLKAKLDEILQNYKGKTVLDIAKLHKEIGTLKGTFKLAKEVSQATRWEQIVEGWRAGLLSGPVTHTTNLLGTEAFHVMRPAVDALASIIGMARGASPGMGESDRASMSEAVARLTGMLGGVQDGIKVAIAEFKADEATGKTEAYRTAIPGQAGRIIRTPLRLMGAEDALVTTMYTRGEIRTLAIRQAFDEDLNPSTREFSERVSYLQDNPTPEMQVAAETAATRMTFNAPLGEKGVALQGFVNKWNLQWMIPFIRTPINIAKELLRMSPFAPAIGEWRQAFAKGGVERDRALAEMALGSGIMAITMAYAFAGNVSGAGSPDPGKNRSKAGVWQPYSILIGDTWYEYARIQPTGTLMGMAADMAAVWDHMTDEEKDKVPKMLSAAFAQAITNQTFLQGIANFVNALSDPTRFGPRFLQSMAGSMVPNIIGQPTTMADPVVREVNSALEAIQARIPGMRQDLLPKRDWLGEPVPAKERLGVVMPIREQEISDDKVRLEAARLDISMAAPPKKTHIGKGTGKLGDVKLTPEEQDKFEQVGGEFAHGILQNIVNAPGYDQMPDMVKRKVFSNVLTAAHRVAAVQALPMEKRIAYLQEITEKVVQELTPGDVP